MFNKLLLALIFLLSISGSAFANTDKAPTTQNILTTKTEHVAVIDLDEIILPGTHEYLKSALEQAENNGAKIFIVNLDTPGGMLNVTQEMVQDIFASPIPIVMYVNPTGATATSAGVFITMAAHIAAMAPGTTIGAAHPVAGDGKDIEGDMRAKAENATISLARSISEERGRNLEWAEKSVKDSDSITAEEALKENVVDLISPNLLALLKSLEGKQVKLVDQEITLEDYSGLPIRNYEMSFQHKALNFISHPNIASLLWLGATTGLSIELYNPGLIVPGVVGVICLVLALTVMQIIPITQAGIIFFVIGSVMIALEFFLPSGILAIGGIIAFVIGAIYLVDPVAAPGLAVDLKLFLPAAITMAVALMAVARIVFKAQNAKQTTGSEGMVGMQAKVVSDQGEDLKVFVNGEYWFAMQDDESLASLAKGQKVEVVEMKNSKTLVVKSKA